MNYFLGLCVNLKQKILNNLQVSKPKNNKNNYYKHSIKTNNNNNIYYNTNKWMVNYPNTNKIIPKFKTKIIKFLHYLLKIYNYLNLKLYLISNFNIYYQLYLII